MIDDSELFRRMVDRIVKKYCQECELVLLDPLSEKMPDRNFHWEKYALLLLDYHLGNEETTGVDWLKRFRQAPAFPPTIMVTGEGTEKVAVEAMKAGADDYLSKEGLEAEILVEMIRNTMRSSNYSVTQGKPEKKTFLRGLSEAIHGTTEQESALFYVEVDNATTIRDKGGLSALNSVMREIEEIIYRFVCSIYPKCEWIRWGDSIVAFQVRGNINESQCLSISKAIIGQAAEQHMELTGGFYPLIVSVGAVIIDSPDMEISSVLKKAEAASRAASIRGGNTAHIFPRHAAEDEKLSKTSVYRVQIREKSAFLYSGKHAKDAPPIDIHKAIEGDSFSMKYYPLIPINVDSGSKNEYFFELLPQYLNHVGHTINHDELYHSLRNSSDLSTYDYYICSMAMKLGNQFLKDNNGANARLFITPVSKTIERRLLFQRLHELIKKFEGRRFGQSMIFRIGIEDYIQQPQHILKYLFELKKLGGAQFCITGVDRVEAFKCVQAYKIFDYVELAGLAESELYGESVDKGFLPDITEAIDNAGTRLIARSVDTSDQLMNALMHGTSLAQGAMVSQIADEMSAESGAVQDIEL